ncbi:GNAT family N-acetyltransferase [Flagellimonas sp.]|uniref:GNAT family N-acetyltransferase n=1 Tax=Flagellimonas sp. TaxID=2058762 RepID=UPI003F49F4DA
MIQKIYLLQEHSGKGYGYQLLEILEDYARNLGKRLVWLDTMQNGTALNFYLKNGFVIHKKSRLALPNAIEEERPMLVLTKEI